MTLNPTPLWEQVAILLIGPPVMACAWWMLSRGMAKTVQAGLVSGKTRRRQEFEFWGLLIIMYVVTFRMTLYAWLRR
jgi:hypothetical protein